MAKPYTIDEAVVPDRPHSVLIMGPLSSRKTTTAATASAFFPESLLKAGAPLPPWPPVSAPINLSDTFYLCWDKDALLGFPRLGLSVPHAKLAEVKPRELIPSKTVTQDDAVLPNIHNDVAKRVAAGVKVIVHDTLGALDLKFQVLCSELFDKDLDNDQAKKNATQVFYRAVLKLHLQEFQFYTALRQPDGSPVTNIFLTHTTVKGDPMTVIPEQVAKVNQQLAAKGLPEGQTTITARLTGSAWEHYMNSCPLIMLSEVRGAEGQKQAILYPKGGKGSLTRDRGGVLNNEEPGNLRAVFAKYGGKT